MAKILEITGGSVLNTVDDLFPGRVVAVASCQEYRDDDGKSDPDPIEVDCPDVALVTVDRRPDAFQIILDPVGNVAEGFPRIASCIVRQGDRRQTLTFTFNVPGRK